MREDAADNVNLSRRAFLRSAAATIGSVALTSILGSKGVLAGDDKPEHWSGVIKPLHHPARCKRVIHLYMAGGPSQLETFDYKPKLAALNGQPMPESFTRGQPVAQLQGKPLTCLQPLYPFQKYGKSQQEICTLFPQIGAIADELCIIRSMKTEQINHDPAHTFMNTGTSISGRPSMGSWVLYGLGSESENLPGFVVLTSSGRGGQMQPIASRLWHSGFLPGQFQGVQFKSGADPVCYLGSPGGVTPQQQRQLIDAIQSLDRQHNQEVEDPEISTRINQYEMAFKMQSSVPDLMDCSNEPKEVLDLYGATGADGSFASNCLVARRLAERGVRFIQVYHRDWDHHQSIKRDIKIKAEEVDRASAALILDLKRRGMLDDTLVVWGGEFGRSPMAQDVDGRDHHIRGFSIFMAGGGIKPGITLGETDELGYNAIQDPVHVHDFHATLLHLLGIDHKRLTYKYQGRDFRLTDVEGNVVNKILA